MHMMDKLRQLARRLTGRRDQVGDLPVHERRKRRNVERDFTARDVGDNGMMRGGNYM